MGCICTSLVVDSYGTVALLNAVWCTLGLNCQFTSYPNLLLQAKKKADAEKAKADAEKVRIDAEARERKAQADTAARAALQRVEAEQKAKQEAQRKASASTGQAKQPVEKTTTTGC
jgi:peptidoglycan hydrolase CwlO-like protein